MKHLIFLTLLSILALSACNDATTNPHAADNILKISGKVTNPNNLEIKDNLKPVLMWNLYDYTRTYQFIWGVGEFNSTDMTFSIDIKDAPLDSCLNKFESCEMGIAYIALLQMDSDYSGRWPSEALSIWERGVALNNAIIYRADNTGGVGQKASWADNFTTGYNYAILKTNPTDNTFESWEYIENNTTLELEYGAYFADIPYWYNSK